MQIFLLIFIRGLRRPYGKGLVGHCTSGHSLNPQLSTTGITVNSKRSVLSEQKSTESHLCMTTYSLSYNQIFLCWFAITNVLATFNCCKLHFSTFFHREIWQTLLTTHLAVNFIRCELSAKKYVSDIFRLSRNAAVNFCKPAVSMIQKIWLWIYWRVANTYLDEVTDWIGMAPVVKVRGARGGGLSPPASTLPPPLLESEPSLPTAGPKLLNSTKNHNVRCRINKF